MATLTVKGELGKEYEFSIHSLNTKFREVGGIYVFTRRYKKSSDQKFYHDLIYCGKTNDLSNRFKSHHKEDCIKRNNANCICFMVVTTEQERKAIEADILSGNDFKCNEIFN